MTLIQTFSDGSELTYDKGTFDGWCVYLNRPNQPKYAPTDLQTFIQFIHMGNIHGHMNIYNDFVSYYSLTASDINTQILNLIHQLSQKYCSENLDIEILFTIVYAGMVAEENKQNAILKKRIKRLGLHQILVENLPPVAAANFSRGKSWRVLDNLCAEKGF